MVAPTRLYVTLYVHCLSGIALIIGSETAKRTEPFTTAVTNYLSHTGTVFSLHIWKRHAKYLPCLYSNPPFRYRCKILVNDQLDALFLNVFISYLYMFRAASAHHQEGQILLIHHLVLIGTSDSHPPECVIPDDVLIQFGPPDDEHLLLETCTGIK
jgi:hypothetical protein